MTDSENCSSCGKNSSKECRNIEHSCSSNNADSFDKKMPAGAENSISEAKSFSLLAQAQFLIDSEQYDNAYELLTASYDKLKNNAEYLEKTALLCKTLDKLDEAEKYLEELVIVNHNSLTGYSELLDIYENKNKYKYYVTRAKYKILNEKVPQAIDDYKKAINSTQDENEIVNARFLLGKVYEAVNKIQNAIDEYLGIIEHKDDLAIYYKLADLYCSINDRYSAINMLERGLKAFPESIDLSEYLFRLYIKEGEYDKALQHAKTDYSKIKAHLMKGSDEEAYKMLQNLSDNNNPDYNALYAEYYYNIKDFDNCETYIDKFAALEPQNPLVYQMRALVCSEKNNDCGYHYNMGRCYSFKGDYELALAEYLYAHRINPADAASVKEIIKINETSGDKTSLIEFYEKLHRLEPENPLALNGLGDMYSDMYEFAQAADYYEKLIKLDPSYYDGYKKLGLCCEKLKQSARARENYEKYIEKAPLSADTEKLKEKISKMPSASSAEDLPSNEEEGFIDKIVRLFKK